MKVKRILAAVVACAMLLSMSVVSFAAAPADLPEYEYEILGSMDIVATDGWKGADKAMTLDAAMVFKAVDSYDEALASAYADWKADYVIEFDQNVTATLAGNYGDYGWIALPEYDFEAGVPVGIMKESGLEKEVSKYSDVVLLVEEFACGLDFADDTPADAKVSLGLYLTNPADETETYLVGKEFVFTSNGLLPEYKAEEIEVNGLDFAMAFEAVDSYDEALENAFADWTADYEITFSNDTTAALSGEYGEYGWVTLDAYDFEAGVPVKVLETAKLGTFTYADIVLLVNKFQCGVDVIDAAYGTEITLSLTLTNADGEKVVVSENVFTYEVLETAGDINGLTPDQVKENADDVKDAIAALDQAAKAEINVDVIKALVDVDDTATEAAGYAVDATVDVDVTAIDSNIEDELAGSAVFEITVTEGGVTVPEVDVPVLVVIPVDTTKTLEKVVHIHNGVAKEITSYKVENGFIYISMSEFSQIGLFYATGAPTCKITEMTAADIAASGKALDYGLIFEVTEDYNAALANPYADWVADFAISFDVDTTATLVGQYGAYGWVELPAYDFQAGVPVKVMETAMLGDFTYADIVLLVNKFQCGVMLEDGSNAVATLQFTLANPTTSEEFAVAQKTVDVDGSAAVEEAAVLKLEEVASANPEESVFDLVLAGNTANWVSGEFTVTVTDGFDYTFVPNGIAANPMGVQNGKTAYNVNLTSYDPDANAADADITLGTITVKNYGAGTIALSDVLMMKEDGSDENIAVKADVTVEGPYNFENIEPSHAVAVKVIFNNKIENVEAAYNEMKVTITTDGVATTFDLGSDNADVTYDATECAYTVKANVKEMHTFDIKVEGAGYRTATYANTMYAADRTITFWNNYKTNGAVMDVENNSSLVNVNFLAGDVYEDGVINTTDLAAVVGQFGKTATAEHDLNRDSKIDSKDVAYVLVSWGK